MTERWTDKKTGFTGSVPASLGNLSMKRFLQEQGGVSITKKTMREDDGSEAIMKGHGMYAKVIHEPVEAVITRPPSLACTPPVDRPDFLTFYRDGATTKVAYLEFDAEGVPILSEACSVASLGIANFTDKVFCHSKRFMHNVQMLNGSIVNRELYLVAMSFEMTPLGSYSGWSTFVANNPSFALVTNTEEIPIESTDDLIRDLDRVNRSVNNGHTYAPDGLLDNWTILGFGEAGDCEDLMLTKASRLLAMGYPASAMRLAVGKTETGLGHAWLVVQTTSGDYALDINYPTLQCDESLPYTHKQRQTGTLWKVVSIFDSFRNAVHAGYDLDRRQPKVWWYIYDPLINKFSDIFGVEQDLPYTRDIRDEMDSVMGVVEWGQVLYPLQGGVSRDTLNACNFSADDNTIYVSQFDGTWPCVYAFNYKEKLVGGIFGQNTIISRAFLGIWFIERNGNVVARTGPSGAHAAFLDLYTGAEVLPLSFYDGIQVSSPDNYFISRLYQHTEVTVPGSTTGVVDTLPTNGSFVTTLVTNDPPPDPPDWQATLDGIAYENVRGIFPADFVEDSFRLKYIYSTKTKKEGAFTGMYFWSISHTMKIPGGSDVNCGSIGGTTSLFPEQARKRALALCYAQGKNEKITGLLITTPMIREEGIEESTKRIYRNGIEFSNKLATSAGVNVGNILGLVYVPKQEAA